jgi:hypothetical protein
MDRIIKVTAINKKYVAQINKLKVAKPGMRIRYRPGTSECKK